MASFVYFDTNVYDHIYKKINFSSGDLINLKNAISSGKISVLLSTLNVEETIALMEYDQSMTIEQVQLIFSLIDKYRVIKPHNELFSEDIESFANRGLESGSFDRKYDLYNKMSFLQNPSQEDIDDFISTVNIHIKNQKEDFSLFMKEVKIKIRPEIKKLKRSQANFIDFFEKVSVLFAESVAEKKGLLEQCRARGIHNLLKVRSIRLYIGYSLSLAFAQFFEDCSHESGDFIDQFQATVSSAADIFVTEDKKFKNRLSRIPIRNYEVIDLKEFTRRII